MPISASTATFQRLHRRWRMGGASTIAALAVLWWTCLGNPALQHQREMNRELVLLTSLAEAEDAILERLSRTIREAEEAERAADACLARVSDERDEARFLKWANLQSQECGLVVRDFRPAGHEIHGTFESCSVLITSQGTYEGVCRFLDRLRASPFMNRLSGLNIVPRDAERTTYSLSLRVKLFNRLATPTRVQQG